MPLYPRGSICVPSSPPSLIFLLRLLPLRDAMEKKMIFQTDRRSIRRRRGSRALIFLAAGGLWEGGIPFLICGTSLAVVVVVVEGGGNQCNEGSALGPTYY